MLTNASVCRFTNVRQSLELYTLHPDHKLFTPRASRPATQRTYESSNYRTLMEAQQKSTKKLSTWIVVRAVEELIKIHAPENWAATFVNELDQSKTHNSDDAGVIAQYLCKCGLSREKRQIGV